MTPPIISIIGKSNSGKTTLIEKLLHQLRDHGYRVATVKHHFHKDESLDVPGKDSYRHAQAGAERVVLVAPLTTVTFDYPSEPPTLQEIAAHLTGFDLVLTEGFKKAKVPSIEVLRRERNTNPVGNPDYWLALATDFPIESSCPVFDLNDIEGLVGLIEREILHSNRQPKKSIGILENQIGLPSTELKQHEQERERLISELEAKNTELERFTYTVSHDLKSPLITINGFLGMLEEDLAANDADRIRNDLDYIRNAVSQMSTLIKNLLELSRIGRLANPPVALGMEELVQEALNLLAGQIAERGVKVDLRPDLPLVYGDRSRLVEVVQNLIDNAIKFMGDQPKPQIAIGAHREAEKVICYVRDNGIGIAPDDQEKVFNLFEHLDPTIEGTGIGLTLAKRIVELHGGRIWVESRGDAQGSTFFFILPSPPEV